MINRSRTKAMLIVATFFSGILQPTTTKPVSKYTVGGVAAVTSACLLSYNKEALASHPLVQKIAKMTNTDPQDLVDVMTLGAGQFTWMSFLLNPDLFDYFAALPEMPDELRPLYGAHRDKVKKYLHTFLVRATLQPLAQVISTSKTWNNFIKQAPLFSKLACAHHDCPGVCDACEYKHIVRKAPFECVNNHLSSNQPLTTTLYYTAKSTAIWQPLWVFLKKNNIFIYRWAQAIATIRNPFIYSHTTCPNQSCEGICHQCKLKKLHA